MRFIFSSLLLTLAIIPAVSVAQSDTNFLVGIPGIGNPDGNFDGYIQAIYAMFISLAALLAVVKIIIAGVKYMFSDIVTQKSQAKNDIKGAILGLLIVLSAVLILTVINPELTNFNLEQQRVNAPAPVLTANNITIDQSCVNTECSNYSIAGGEVVEQRLPRETADLQFQQDFILGCSNSGGTPNAKRDGDQTVFTCFTLSATETQRVTDIYLENNPDGNIDSFLRTYQRDVAPFLETNFANDILFVADVESNMLAGVACQNLGGTNDTGLLASSFRCIR